RLLLMCSCGHRALHSFPTRRSSDLIVVRIRDDLVSSLLDDAIDRCKARPGQIAVTFGAGQRHGLDRGIKVACAVAGCDEADDFGDRKSTRLNSSHVKISYAVFCLKK